MDGKTEFFEKFVGKKCKIIVNLGDGTNYYTGVIQSLENNFLVFIDKFGEQMGVNLDSVIQIKLV